MRWRCTTEYKSGYPFVITKNNKVKYNKKHYINNTQLNSKSMDISWMAMNASTVVCILCSKCSTLCYSGSDREVFVMVHIPSLSGAMGSISSAAFAACSFFFFLHVSCSLLKNNFGAVGDARERTSSTIARHCLNLWCFF